MKKNLNLIVVIILALGLLLGAGLYYYFSKQKRGAGVEDFVSSGAVFYGRLTHVEKNLNAFLASSFWKKVAQVDWVKVLEANKTDAKVIEQLKQALSSITQASENPLVKDFFGQELALVVYPLTGKQDAANPQTYLENFIFVTKLKPQANVIETVTSYFYAKNKDGNVPVVTENYKGQTVTRVRLPQGVEVTYTKIQDYLIAGVAPKYVHASIDVFKKQGLALSRDQKFVEARSIVNQPSDGFVFFDLESTLGQFRKTLEGLAASAGPNAASMQEFFNRTDGLQLYVLSFNPGPPAHVQFRMTMNKNLMKPEIRDTYNFEETKNETLKFIPANVAGYQWGNFYDFEKYWDQMKVQLSGAAQGRANLNQSIAQLEEQLGVSIANDLIPNMGSQIGGYLSGFDTSGMFPMPLVTIFLKVNDVTKAQELMKKFLGKNPILLLKQEDYKKAAINYFTIPLGVTLEPGYCFVDDYLLFSTSRNLLKASIDAKSGTASLATDVNFTETDPGLSGKSNYVFYLRGDLLAQGLKSLMAWADAWTADKLLQTEAFKSGAQNKLDDLRQELKAKDEKIQEAENSLEILQADALQAEAEERAKMVTEGITPGTSMEEPTEGADAASKLMQLASLKEEAASLEKERSALKANEPEYISNIKGFDEQILEAEKLKFMMREVIGPMLQALESLKSTSTRMSFRDKSIEAEFFLKAE